MLSRMINLKNRLTIVDNVFTDACVAEAIEKR